MIKQNEEGSFFWKLPLDLSGWKMKKSWFRLLRIYNRFRQEEGHQELARILCGWVKRVGLKRLQIDAKQFEAIHELEEFGAMLENVLPDMIERVKKGAKEENTNKIAKNLLDLWLAIEKIIQATGLSEQDILSLKTKKANA